MLAGKRITVVMPAYNASATLLRTVEEIDRSIVDDVILVDDGSQDNTKELSRSIQLPTFVHHQNFGYGRNQKTCYGEALKTNPDIVIMLHPDYQYSPKLLPAMASMIASGEYDVVLGSRILGGTAIRGGMPFYKYLSNRFLTATQNLLLGSKLSEFHTGYRAYSADTLRQIPFWKNSDDFLFDNELLAQAVYHGFRIGEISCPTKYMPEASSINFRRSVIYGIGVLWTSVRFFLQRTKLASFALFQKEDPKMPTGYYYRLDEV